MACSIQVEASARIEASQVTIRTQWPARGVASWFERILAPRLLRPLHLEELRNLASVAKEHG